MNGDDDGEGDLGKGCVIGLLLAAPIWVLLAWAAWWLRGH